MQRLGATRRSTNRNDLKSLIISRSEMGHVFRNRPPGEDPDSRCYLDLLDKVSFEIILKMARWWFFNYIYSTGIEQFKNVMTIIHTNCNADD